MIELVDSRILGALRLVDAVSGVPIRRRLHLHGTGLRFRYTRSSNYVITSATGFENSTRTFDAPTPEPARDFDVQITDTLQKFQPRRASFTLPRDFDPGSGVRDLQTPIVVELSSSASRTPAPAWATAVVKVIDHLGRPIPGALVEIFSHGTTIRIAWGLVNKNSEAILAVAGLRPFQEQENDPTTPDDNVILTNTTQVRIQVTADPDLPWPADPKVLESGDTDFVIGTIGSFFLEPGKATQTSITLDLS